jgi:hypothetical protein
MGLADGGVRNLAHLETSASTSRVLNLRAIHKLKRGDPDYAARPLFQNSVLNTSIIVKHRLRANELDEFPSQRTSATKILVPIDSDDLRLGARYAFIGQRGFEQSLRQAFGVVVGENSQDLRALSILDETPTLDPFLLREQFRRHGIEPALCYFELSKADTKRMFDFAQREIEPLVRMSLSDGASAAAFTVKLTQKILSNEADAELEPLRRTMQLDPQQFHEGVFCWKAFLYYKWQLADLLPKVAPVLKQIEQVRPQGPQDDDIKSSLKSSRETLRGALISCCRNVKAVLETYDDAYGRMTRHSDPGAFRDFLLKAPAMFDELGQRLGSIEHIVSFWRFRFPGERPPVITPEELCEVFRDFEGSLSFEKAA